MLIPPDCWQPSPTPVQRLYVRMLTPFSWVYHWVGKARFRWVTPETLPVPVLCVGNATIGGGGKTPTTLLLARLLQAHGARPAIISRGYGGSITASTEVNTAQHTAQEVGDEPLLLARVAPCYIGKNRRASAALAIKNGADIILMDDGLQNPQLAKTLSLLVIDGGYGFGNQRVFPAGALREPLKDIFAKVQACMVIGKDEAGVIGQLPRNLPLIRANMELTLPECLPHAAHVLAFCGIARPAKFYDSLKGAGVQCVEQQDFPDHHFFTEAELHGLWQRAEKHGVPLVTTEKDWVRLPLAWQEKILAIPAHLRVHPPEPLWQVLHDYGVVKNVK